MSRRGDDVGREGVAVGIRGRQGDPGGEVLDCLHMAGAEDRRGIVHDAEAVAYFPGAVNEMEVELSAMHVDGDRAKLGERADHGGVVEAVGAASLAGAAGDRVDRSGIGTDDLEIGTVSVRLAIARLDDVLAGIERTAESVVAIEESAAFVGVAVAIEDEVDPAAFEDGEKNLAHVRHAARGIAEAIRVVRTLGVGRVVPEGDGPFLLVGIEISGEPLGHGTRGAARRVVGIEADEMGIGVIERIVGAHTGGEAAAFAR